jgi:hypothetical protein
MVTHAVLNHAQHKDLRVQTGYGEAYGDDVMCVMAIPSEFRNLVADYPIFLHKDPGTGRLTPMAMFGFQDGENLFLGDDGWQASYVPLLVRRGPFLIGFQGGEAGSGTDRNMVVSIDMDNPRVGSEGEPLFQPFGGNSDYTEEIIHILQEIDQGQSAIEELGHMLEQHDLVEPFSLEVRLQNGKQHRLEGFLTINEEKLADLDAEVLADLSRRGVLHSAYMVLASMANMPRLLELKNKRA